MRDGWLRRVRRTHTIAHVAAYLATAVLLFAILGRLSPVLSPLLAALGIAYLLDPLVERMSRRGVPRAAAVTLILGTFLVVFVGVVVVLVPLVAEDVRRFAAQVPALVASLADWLHRMFGVQLPTSWREALGQAGEHLRGLGAGAARPLLVWLAGALAGVLALVGGLLQLLFVPLFAFYLLLDWQRLVAAARELMPRRHRAEVVGLVVEIDRVVSSWVRGALTVVAIQAVLYPIALSLCGIHLAVPIGILAGILTIVPYVGTAVGLGLAVLMSLVGWQGYGPLLGVLAVFAGLHVLESIVLTPILVGRRVGLGEAGALVAVIAGGELLGFVGIVLAIPLAAATAVVVRRLLRAYRESDFYREGEPAPDASSLAPERGP